MNNRLVIESAYQPRSHLLDFHARGNRFAILVFHRRAGKTVGCINDIVDKALQNHLPMPRYGYIAPFYKQAKDIAWSYLKHYAGPMLAKPPMESELSVLLKNGALVRLYGADNPDSLRGVYFDGVILDEYGQMSPRLFGEVIAPTLADRKGWAVFIGTPAGPNHFYELWNAAQDDDRWFTKMLKASQSGILDAEELAMLANLPGSDEDTFNQEFECDFMAAIRGAYYGKLLNKLDAQGNFLGDFPYDPSRSVLTAWDIGYTDDTSVWFFQHDGTTIRVIDFFTASGYSVEDVADVLRTKPYAYGPFYLPHDAKNKSFQTGKSTREQLIEMGAETVIIPNLSIQDGIQAVRATLPTMQFNISGFKHDEGVRLGLSALRTYQREWDDKNRRFRDAPLHNWASNPADAMRMLALAMNPGAARRAAKRLQSSRSPTTIPHSIQSKALNLDSLFAEREQMRNENRRI